MILLSSWAIPLKNLFRYDTTHGNETGANTHVQGVQVSITGTNRQEHTCYPTWMTNSEHGCSSERETSCFEKVYQNRRLENATLTWLYFLFLEMSTRWQWRASNQEPLQKHSVFYCQNFNFHGRKIRQRMRLFKNTNCSLIIFIEAFSLGHIMWKIKAGLDNETIHSNLR